jgi:hypothetical protein
MIIRKEGEDYYYNYFLYENGKKIGYMHSLNGFELDKELDISLDIFKESGSGTFYIGSPNQISLTGYRLINESSEIQEQNEKESRERGDAIQKSQQDCILKNIEKARLYREDLVKKIWKEKNLSKAEKLLEKFESSSKMAGRMRLGEYW